MARIKSRIKWVTFKTKKWIWWKPRPPSTAHAQYWDLFSHVLEVGRGSSWVVGRIHQSWRSMPVHLTVLLYYVSFYDRYMDKRLQCEFTLRGIRLCPYINVYFSIICYESWVSGFSVSLHDWPMIHEIGGSCIAYTLS